MWPAVPMTSGWISTTRARRERARRKHREPALGTQRRTCQNAAPFGPETTVRIASLLPAATEIACALGAQDEVVARSHECDFPRGVERARIVTRTRLAPLPSSRDIDRDLRDLVARALAVYELDVDALRAAAPDVILTQDLCDVCALPYEAVRAAACAVLPNAALVRLSPLRLADVWADVRRVGAALGRTRAAEALVARAEQRLAALAARVPESRARPSVLTIEWIDPVMIGATWMPELVELAGGRALVATAGAKAPTLARAELAALRPDVVLIKPCGFALERTRAERAAIAALLAGPDGRARLDWPALARGSVWVADGNAFFNRPGPRLVESCEILAACVHPDLFEDCAARHAGSFERWSDL
jgi:iron complex transport system substrate-binding protein